MRRDRPLTRSAVIVAQAKSRSTSAALFDSLDLVTLILDSFHKRAELASLALVNRTFCAVALKKIYTEIGIGGGKWACPSGQAQF